MNTTPVWNDTQYRIDSETYKAWRANYQPRPSFACVTIWTLFVLLIAAALVAVLH